MAEAHSEREESQIARTAVPLPFLPGHLAAPTLIDDPAQRRIPVSAYTIPMPPPEEKTEPISGSELLDAPQVVRPGQLAPAPMPRTHAHAPTPAAGSPPAHDPRLAHAARSRILSATVPLAQVYAQIPAAVRPEGAPQVPALPLAGPVERAPMPPVQTAPSRSPEAAPTEPGPASNATTQVTLATKVLLALLVVLVVTLVGVFGGRPRHGHQASHVSAGGIAAGTSSPESTGIALLTR
jgi:hypothetical protein